MADSVWNMKVSGYDDVPARDYFTRYSTISANLYLWKEGSIVAVFTKIYIEDLDDQCLPATMYRNSHGLYIDITYKSAAVCRICDANSCVGHFMFPQRTNARLCEQHRRPNSQLPSDTLHMTYAAHSDQRNKTFVLSMTMNHPNCGSMMLGLLRSSTAGETSRCTCCHTFKIKSSGLCTRCSLMRKTLVRAYLLIVLSFTHACTHDIAQEIFIAYLRVRCSDGDNYVY